MSRLARSLANSLRLDDDDNESASSRVGENDVVTNESPSSPRHRRIQNEETGAAQQSLSPEQVAELQSRGVKEDLTELKQTITRQFWGVATFLAPPPPPPPPPRSSTQFNHQSNDASICNLNQSEPWDQSISGGKEDPSDSAAVEGIKDYFAKIGSLDHFPLGSEENEEENEIENENEEGYQEFNAIGITDEVLAFARNIGHHPETWLDFPLDPDEDLDDFDMSVTQQEHAIAVEHLAPRLGALRIELCPCHMSDSYFWKVYFVLLHSRLNKNDAEILSTPQVMEARALWMKELQKQTKPETDWYGRSTYHLGNSSSIMHEDFIPSSSSYFAFETSSPRTYTSEPASSITTDYEIEKHPVEGTEKQFIDKSVIEEKPVSNTEDKHHMVGPSSKILIPTFEDDEIDWPEDDSEFGGYSGAAICAGNEEDISFSDLEDFDESSTAKKSKMVSKGFETSKT